MAKHQSHGLVPFTLKAIPLSVLNRALELCDYPPSLTRNHAFEALCDALSHWGESAGASDPYTPFAQAVAEYLSQSGPWAPTGPHASEFHFEIED